MNHNLCSYGLILDIDPNKFSTDGLIYINEDYADRVASNLEAARMRLQKSTFQFVTSKLIQDHKGEDLAKNKELLNDEIDKIFKERKDRRIDVIVMAQDSFSGKYKNDVTSMSILYLNLESNVSLGFFINKNVAEIMFRNKEVSDIDSENQ